MIPHWWYRDLYEGDEGPDVAVVALKLGGKGHVLDPDLVALLRGFQRLHGLPMSGMVDRATATTLGESPTYGLVPQWYSDALDEDGLRAALHIRSHSDLGDAIRRFQSARGHYPTGEMTEALAIEIGD